MGSRTRIAAAACLIASGLLATGSSASLAFAAPDSGSSGGEGGTGSSSSPGTGSGEPAGAPTGQAPTGSTTSPSTGSIGPWGSIFRPPSTVGNGRTGFDFKLPDIGSLIPTFAKPSTTAPSKATTSPVAPSAPAATPSAPALPAGTAAPTTGAAAGIDPSVGLGQIGTGAEAPTSAPEQPAATPVQFSWWNVLPSATPVSGGGGATAGPGGGFIVQRPVSSLPFADVVLPLPEQALTQLLAPGQAIPGFAMLTDPIVDVVAGLSTAASQLPFLSVSLPVIVVPDGVEPATLPVVGRGRAPVPSAPRVTLPAGITPTVTPADAPTETSSSAPEAESPPPVTALNTQLLAAPTYRMGYVDYLRAAGLGEVAAVAVPGVTGILVLTGAGGLIGFRQARAGRAVRAGGTARFMG